MSAVFALAPDKAGSATAPDGRVVFKITTDTTPPYEAADPGLNDRGAEAHGRAANRASSTNSSPR